MTKKTKGIIYRFNTNGIEMLKKVDVSGNLVEFFNRARDMECNAFVLNVLVVSPSELSSNSSPSNDTSDFAVGWHRDATLALKPGASTAGIPHHLANSVTVLYLSIPELMSGGTLCLRDPKKGREI